MVTINPKRDYAPYQSEAIDAWLTIRRNLVVEQVIRLYHEAVSFDVIYGPAIVRWIHVRSMLPIRVIGDILNVYAEEGDAETAHLLDELVVGDGKLRLVPEQA